MGGGVTVIGIPISEQMKLELRSRALAGTFGLAFEWVILTLDGQLVTSRDVQQCTTGTTSPRKLHNLPNGWLVSVAVTSNEDMFSDELGRARVALVLPGVGVEPGHVLLDGLITSQHAISWPYSDKAPTPIHGMYQTLTGANPGAGAEPDITVSSQMWFLLLAAQVTLVTDATVGNRECYLAIGDGASALWPVSVPVNTQAASTTSVWHWRVGMPVEQLQTGIRWEPVAPGPLWVPPGGTIRVEGNGIVAGDDFSALTAVGHAVPTSDWDLAT